MEGQNPPSLSRACDSQTISSSRVNPRPAGVWLWLVTRPTGGGGGQRVPPSGGGLRGAGRLRKCPPGSQSKIPVVKKGKMTFLTKREKMTPLTPGTLHWGHLHRHSAPRNPPPLVPPEISETKLDRFPNFKRHSVLLDVN